MLNILKYLKKHVGLVLVIVALLVVQAYCDLTLPQYTSDIVDVGIQQGGIERVTPDQLRSDSLEELALFLTDEEEDLFRASYTLDEDGVYILNTGDEDVLTQLDTMLGMPMVMLSYLPQQGMDGAQLRALVESGALTREQIRAMVSEAESQMGATTQTIVDQMAVTYVQAEYEALGVDLDAYQQHYLLVTGGKMLALTLLMVAAAILGGLLSSRVAASVGIGR